MKLLVHLAGDDTKASSRVRGYWIAEELQKLGYSCTLRCDHSKLGLMRLALDIASHDVLVFQKTYSRYHKWLLMQANALGKPAFLDLDDAPSRIKSSRTLRNVEWMMSRCSGVIVGSANLYDYARRHQCNVHVVPSGIKLSNYSVVPGKRDAERICLGWIGNGAHYTEDLIEILAGPLATLAARHKVRLKLVGACGMQKLYDTFGRIEGLAVDFVDQLDWASSHAVAEAIADFDIGLYPLLRNDFNQYKCGFKALEYMASGLPVVSSDSAANKELIADGIDGFIVTSEDEWTSALSRLIEDAELRRRMGSEGRRKVENQFATDKLAKRIDSIIAQT